MHFKAQPEVNGEYFYNLGMQYFDPKRTISGQQARQFFEKSASWNYPDGIYELARCYDSGRGGQDNVYKAFELYKKANERADHKDACFALAQCYEFGHGTGVDFNQALQYYKKAAALGHQYASRQVEKYYAEPNFVKNKLQPHTW